MAIKKIIKQSSNYFWGEAAVMGASFISFPILTRIFTKEQYGLMALLGVTSGIVGAMSSLGLNRSIVRYYHGFKKSSEISVFVGSLFNATLLMQLAALLLSIGAGWLLLAGGLISFRFFSLLPIALGVVMLRNIFLLLNTLYRMDEEVLKYNAFSIARQYSAMVAGIGFVLIYENLYSFYAAQVVAQIVVLGFLVLQCSRKIGPFVKKNLSSPVLKQSLSYGIPLALSAICGMIFNLGDRYVIAYFLGAEPVASYSVAFNLCNYFKEIVVTSINLSLIPLTYKMWGQGNITETAATLASILKYYAMAVIPVLCIYILIPGELITIIASQKYAEASSVLPVLMAGIVIGFNFPFSAGLHLKQKSLMIMLIIFAMSAVNIILNCFLVPFYGILGAAFSTLICGVGLIVSFYLLSKKFVPIQIPYRDIAKYALLAGVATLVLFAAMKIRPFDPSLVYVIGVSLVFLIVYTGLLFVFDADARAFFLVKARPGKK